MQSAFLTGFENAVVTGAVIEDARGHVVEADGLLLTLGQCQIGDGARQAAVPITEWMQGDEPEMSDAGTQKGIKASIFAAAFELGDKARQLRFQSCVGRGFEMYGRLVDSTGNDLHGLFTTQCADVFGLASSWSSLGIASSAR